MLNFKKKTIKNVCLIGLMGSGKSMIGRDLSKVLNLDFYDTDYEIEQNVGKSINYIFTKYGEEYFRNIEEEVCLKILKNKNCVISLGGGSITSPKIRNMINENSFSIYLKVDLKILHDRLKNSKKRPLLKNVDRKTAIETLYNKRKFFYNNANLIIENNFEKNDIVLRIVDKLKSYD